jgi:RNA polymerase sigma-70 factor, ECF subfamily
MSDHQNEQTTKFEQVAFAHMDSLYSTALRLTRNTEEAEDLVQETYLRAFRFFDKFQEGTNFKAWIFKILTNTFINKYRQKVKAPQKVQMEKVEYGLKSEAEDSPSSWTGYDEARYSELFDDDIQSALSQLPEEFRMIVLLADVEGFSYKDIAEMINRPIGTVMSRLFRGRKILQKILEHYAHKQGYIRNN